MACIQSPEATRRPASWVFHAEQRRSQVCCRRQNTFSRGSRRSVAANCRFTAIDRTCRADKSTVVRGFNSKHKAASWEDPRAKSSGLLIRAKAFDARIENHTRRGLMARSFDATLMSSELRPCTRIVDVYLVTTCLAFSNARG